MEIHGRNQKGHSTHPCPSGLSGRVKWADSHGGVTRDNKVTHAHMQHKHKGVSDWAVTWHAKTEPHQLATTLGHQLTGSSSSNK